MPAPLRWCVDRPESCHSCCGRGCPPAKAHSQTDNLALVPSTVAHGPGHCRPPSERQCPHRNGDHVGAEGVAAQRLPGARQELVCSGLKGNPHARVSWPWQPSATGFPLLGPATGTNGPEGTAESASTLSSRCADGSVRCRWASSAPYAHIHALPHLVQRRRQGRAKRCR